jgi:tight adherence protein B
VSLPSWARRARQRDGPRLAAVASMVQRLAVLLAAGVTPAAAWGYVDGTPAVARVAADAARAIPVATALVAVLPDIPAPERPAWRALAAAWWVAAEAGAPLAPSLRQFASSLRALADAQREIGVAMSGPVATARLVMVLPAVGVLFGLVLGFNTLEILFTTLPGLVCLVVGCGLMVTALVWNRRLVRAARPSDLAPGLQFELTAIAVSGGNSLERAGDSVSRALAAAGVDTSHAAAAVEGVLELSRRAGAPAGDLLRSEAEEARRDARAQAAVAASVLGVKLMLPLGLCILPAFMLLGVAPLLLAVITSTVSGF